MGRFLLPLITSLLLIIPIGAHLKAEILSSILLENFKQVVVARQSGIVKLHVNEGARLSIDDNICEVDVEKLKLRMKLAELKYQEAAISLEIAKIKFRRKEELFEAGGISKDTFELLKMEHEVPEKQTGNKVDVTLAGVELEQKKLEKELLALELESAFYTAPADGQIIKFHVRNQQWISAGSKLYEFLSIKPLFVAVNIPLKRLKTISQNKRLKLSIDTGAKIKKVDGIVDYIVDELDTIDQNVRILIKINNEKLLFKPGMRVKVHLP